MKSADLDKLVRHLHEVVGNARKKLKPNELNEEWTKQTLILPLLKELGWDSAWEIRPESHPDGTEGSIDYLLQPLAAEDRRCCIEAKSLLVTSPKDRSHPQIVKGLEQTEQRKAAHFVWTNGDTWQFLALAMPDAPIYEVTISATRGIDEEIARVTTQFQVLEKAAFLENPKAIDEAIQANWKAVALPSAFRRLQCSPDLLDLMKRELPENLEVDSEEVLKFLRTCQPKALDMGRSPISRGRTEMTSPSPEEWEKLINSPEPRYQKAKIQLLQNKRRKLAEYIVGEAYEPWRATITYSILGFDKRCQETKTVTGPAVGIYRKWGFIKPQDPSESRPNHITYERVEEGVGYLKRLLKGAN